MSFLSQTGRHMMSSQVAVQGVTIRLGRGLGLGLGSAMRLGSSLGLALESSLLSTVTTLATRSARRWQPWQQSDLYLRQTCENFRLFSDARHIYNLSTRDRPRSETAEYHVSCTSSIPRGRNWEKRNGLGACSFDDTRSPPRSVLLSRQTTVESAVTHTFLGRDIRSKSTAVSESGFAGDGLRGEAAGQDGGDSAEWTRVPMGPLAKLLMHDQIRQIHKFVDILLDWNNRMNLTTVVERSAVMERHVEDSLALLPVITSSWSWKDSNGAPRDSTERQEMDTWVEQGRLRVVDVGSGAGLPGVILAIAKPDWDFTLVDSMSKRCQFLEVVTESVGLKNVVVVCSRAETMGSKGQETREFYDVAVARAVAELRVLAEFCLPLVKVGGVFVSAKGPDPEEEVENAKKAISTLGGELICVSRVDSTGPLGQRTAVVCRKKHPTALKFPRPNNLAKRQPL